MLTTKGRNRVNVDEWFKANHFDPIGLVRRLSSFSLRSSVIAIAL